MVYVYGGIKANGEGDKEHHPIIADPLIEFYDPIENKWSEIIIPNAPPLAAFGYTTLLGKMIILGGTDGEIMTESTVEINFFKRTAATLDDNMGQ